MGTFERFERFDRIPALFSSDDSTQLEGVKMSAGARERRGELGSRNKGLLGEWVGMSAGARERRGELGSRNEGLLGTYLHERVRTTLILYTVHMVCSSKWYNHIGFEYLKY